MSKKRGMFRTSVKPATDAVGYGGIKGRKEKQLSSHQLSTTKGRGARGAVARQHGRRHGGR